MDLERSDALPRLDTPAGAVPARRTWREGIAWFRSSLAVRLLARVLLFSSLVTLALTILQLYLDYRRDVGAIEARLGDIQRSYLGSIGESLWQLDDKQLTLQLEGILRLPDIRWAEVRETTPRAHPLVMTAGQRDTGPSIDREFPIAYAFAGGERVTGVLRVQATLAEVFRELLARTSVILVSQGAKTFLVSLFIILIVHRLVTSHLASIAEYLRGYDLRRAASPLRLHRRPPTEPDELDRMVDAFNQARDGLERVHRELEQELAARDRIAGQLRDALDELIRSEEDLRGIFDHALEGIVRTSIDGRVLSANAAYARIMGFATPAEAIAGVTDLGRQLYADPADRDRFIAMLAADGVAIGFESAARRPDGRLIWLLTNSRSIRDATGKLVAIESMVSDITERKRMETALRDSELRFRDYAEIASDWFWETGPDHGFTYVSRRVGAHGFTPDNRIGMKRWQFATDVEAEPEQWREHRETLEAHRPFRDFTYRTQQIDGAVAYIATSGKPLFDATGVFLGYRGGSRDITSAMVGQQALRLAKEQEMLARAERLELLQRLMNAQEHERLRLARELHDQVGQDLTGLSLGLKSLEASIRDAGALATLGWLRSLTEQIGSNLHRTAWELRPTSLDDVGLTRALEAYVVDWSERFGIRVDFHAAAPPTERFLPEIETAAYRVVQEALTNVVKHAEASVVSLVLERHENALQIIVEDDGRGFDPAAVGGKRRLGLAGMRERIDLLGGTLTIDAASGGGTTLYFRLPLRAANVATDSGN